MSIGDLIILEQANITGRGSSKYNVAAGATTINPGEPVVLAAIGATTVLAAPNNSPVVGSDYFVGIASTTSTQTSGTAGTVGVLPVDYMTTWLISPKVAATFGVGTTPSQSTYDALVGHRFLIDLTSGTYTLLATNTPTNGAVLMPMNVLEHPGKVAVAFRIADGNLSGNY